MKKSDIAKKVEDSLECRYRGIYYTALLKEAMSVVYYTNGGRKKY